jgi:exopolysaccharide biosynthesis protein
MEDYRLKHRKFPDSTMCMVLAALTLAVLFTSPVESIAGRPPRKRATVNRPQPAQLVLTQAENKARHPMRVTTNAEYTLVECDIRDLHLAVVDTGATISQFTEQRPWIMAAMNGGFFDFVNGRMAPTGLVISDDVMYSPAACRICSRDDGRKRSSRLASKACAEQGWYDIFAVDQMNRISVMPSVVYEQLIGNTSGELRLALEAGPTLVSNGVPAEKGSLAGRFSRRAYPRTAFGIARDGRILLLTTRIACPLYKVAKMLAGHDAMWAMNLDGDSSTNMLVTGNTAAGVTHGPKTKLNTFVYVTQ